ncbi:MAG: sugar ABC transporter ATP-binding protein [Actinomycetota bacterium]|jgi:ribose transport system ATP-binding protein|nr:sugar ABC transporter ATP-binding protein [Actinomycetota bacterium]
MAASGGADAPPLAVAGLSKRFGAVVALRDVSFEVGHGEVVALLGKNGSGKSTLIKILAGYHEADAGEVWLEGVDLGRSVGPAQVREHGLGFVHQDLALFGGLSVAENMLAASRVLPTGSDRYRVQRRAEATLVADLLHRYGVGTIDPQAKVANLTAGERALIAIVRAAEAVSDRRYGGVLVLDEPTAFLGRRETARLFELLAQLAASGKSVVLVTHNVREVREVADRVVILRDGAVVADEPLGSLSDDEVVSHIVGGVNEPAARAAARRATATARQARAEVVLEAARLTGPGVADVSLELRSGEVLGVAGLVGSGADVLPRALFGACDGFRGTVTIGGESCPARSLTPRRAIDAGVALVPGDRLGEGLAAGLTLAENLSLPVLATFFDKLRLRLRKLARRAENLCTEFEVKTEDAGALVSQLSGGNQQKVLVAKWMAEHPAVLLLDEPTQGVDVGARESLYELIGRGIAGGAAVLWHSSDMEELAATCDRVLVMSGGSVVAELGGEDVNEVALQRALTGARSGGDRGAEE